GNALELARDGVRTGGDPRNREFAPVEADGVPEEVLALGYDAQTAGGLLIALPAEKALSLQAEFERNDLFLERIGAVEAGSRVSSVRRSTSLSSYRRCAPLTREPPGSRPISS